MADDKESKVAYVRVQEILPYLQDVLNIHEKQGNTWEHEDMKDEVWIKIGVSNHLICDGQN